MNLLVYPQKNNTCQDVVTNALLASNNFPAIKPARWKCELLYVSKTFSGGNQSWLHSLDGQDKLFAMRRKEFAP
jgi:hypothetical protein